MYDYYITVNENNEVTNSFTTGVRQPQAGDIMVEERNPERCWSLNLIDMETGKYQFIRDEADQRGYREKPEAELKDIEWHKARKKDKIKIAFSEAFNGGLDCSLGFKIDCRRNDKSNDLQNYEALLQYMEANEITETTVKLYDNTMSPSVDQDGIKTIIAELIAYGISLYNQKWTVEAEVDTAATIEAVEAIEF